MATQKKKSPLIQIGSWTISLFCFAIGFWHTHLGIKEFKVLSSDYGSLVVAGVVLLVMIISYSIAINGRKWILTIYIVCALIFFIFNLNSFYPSYLGRTLVKEEAKALNDSITVYKSKVDKIVGLSTSTYYQRVQDLRNTKANILREIESRGGFGPHATAELRRFNSLAESNISADRNLGRTEKEIKDKVEFYTKQLDDAINDFLVKSLSGKEQGALKLVSAKNDMEDIIIMYNEKLEDIIKDNSDINLDSIKTNSQIKTLQEVVTKLEVIAIEVNSVKHPPQFNLFNKDNEEAVQPKTQHLGKFAHTISSVNERISKLDTIGVIGVCLVIDFLAPLAVYFFLRKKDDEDERDESTKKGWGKNDKKPVNFND